MRTIWKFPLEIIDKQILDMPPGNPLCVQMQDGHVFLWASVDSGAPLIKRAVWIVGTGNQISIDADSARYVGTVQSHGGRFVWHVFMEEQP